MNNINNGLMFEAAKGELLCDLLHGRDWLEALNSWGHDALVEELGVLLGSPNAGVGYGQADTDFLKILGPLVEQVTKAVGTPPDAAFADGVPELIPQAGTYDATEFTGSGNNLSVGVSLLDIFLMASMDTMAAIKEQEGASDPTGQPFVRVAGQMDAEQIRTLRILAVRFGGLIRNPVGADLIQGMGMLVEQLTKLGQDVMW